MPKEIDFSSYECDCGHQSHFFENTIREAKTISHKRTVHLCDSEADEHTIVFKHGKMVEILCSGRILSGNREEKAHAVTRPRRSQFQPCLPEGTQLFCGPSQIDGTSALACVSTDRVAVCKDGAPRALHAQQGQRKGRRIR